MAKKIKNNKIYYIHKNYKRKDKKTVINENLEKEKIKDIEIDKTENNETLSTEKISEKDGNKNIKRKDKSFTNEESLENNIEKIQKKSETANLDFIRKLKKKIRNTNVKNIFSFLLEEYTGTSLINKLFDSLSLKKTKIIYHLLMTLYNFYLNKDKAIVSAILAFISLIND